MTAHRSQLPIVFVHVALLLAATTCLTVSYAGINETPRNLGKVVDVNDVPKARSEGHAWFGGQEEARAEQLEHENEIAHMAERAEEAREETEEEREDQKKSTGEDRPRAAVLRAHIELINTRNPTTGTALDPCTHSIPFLPVDSRIELRFTTHGSNAVARTMRDVATNETCSPQGDFYVDTSSAPARIKLCPDACVWAKSAMHDLAVDVFIAGP